MSRWGTALVWFGLGVALVAGCGGRTGALDGDLYADDDGSFSGSGAGGSRAGAGQGGSVNVAGSRPLGGSAPVAGRGGASFGGSTSGGAGPIGGVGPIGGTATGGVGPIGGTATGGFAGFGAVGGTGPLDCQACLTQACTPQVAQCFQDPGCIAIFACVVSSGCNTLECYSPNYCKTIIDQFGGPMGNSVRQVFDVVSCALNSGCDCP